MHYILAFGQCQAGIVRKNLSDDGFSHPTAAFVHEKGDERAGDPGDEHGKLHHVAVALGKLRCLGEVYHEVSQGLSLIHI